MNHRNEYILILPDGLEFPGNFSQIMDRLTQDFELKASRELVQKRILAYRDRRAIATELIRPALSRKEAGAIRWAKMGTPCIHSYSGVEGIAGPVSARQVWKILVGDAGKSGPVKETIRRRLKQGLRRRAELLADQSVGRPKGWRGIPGERVISNSRAQKTVKKQVLPKSTVSAVLSQAQQLPVVSGCGNTLPEMRDYVPDTRVYRRQPLR